MKRVKIYFGGLKDGGEYPIDLVRSLRVGGFKPPQGPPGPQENKYDALNQEADSLFQVVGLEEADLVIYPYRADGSQAVLAEIANRAKERGVPCIFFSWGDADVPISVPYGTVYRHSLKAGHHLPHERAMPAFCADPLEGSAFSARTKEKVPTVGFCGYVGDPVRRLMYRLMGRTEKVAGLALRARVLKSLRRSPQVRSQFIIRKAYWAGTTGRFHHNSSAQRTAWDEFRDNLLSSDYAVCIRGAGNFSYRFYEVMAAGRIPLLINTQCVLPFPETIDWQRHCVWIEENQIDRAGDILADFHAALSPRQFIELQRENRRLWLETLSPLGFYRAVGYFEFIP